MACGEVVHVRWGGEEGTGREVGGEEVWADGRCGGALGQAPSSEGGIGTLRLSARRRGSAEVRER